MNQSRPTRSSVSMNLNRGLIVTRSSNMYMSLSRHAEFDVCVKFFNVYDRFGKSATVADFNAAVLYQLTDLFLEKNVQA
jgi:hypothetical protein